MATEKFQKGRFYSLPIVDIRNEGGNSFFIVSANDKEYAIRMFAFQRADPAHRERKELPCMVKDVHGGNIVFVQNFARMFGDRYVAGKRYPFVVKGEATCMAAGGKYYDVCDENGVPFRIKCPLDTLLLPNQKVYCTVSRPTSDRLALTLANDTAKPAARCVSPDELLRLAGVCGGVVRLAKRLFANSSLQAEARACYQRGSAEWVVKALMAVPDLQHWPYLREDNRKRMLSAYYHACLYLLEDSDYLLQFSESDRENYQHWIADKASKAETYLQCLELMKSGSCREETDTILRKIRSSGYIYHPHHRMELLIAIFTMQPELLEEEIDPILDLVQECAKDWRQPSFYEAFSSFLRFYILSNRDRANRVAVVGDSQSRHLLARMVRSISFLLLMTDGKEPNVQLYRSMLLHYLSFVRTGGASEGDTAGRKVADALAEQAFATLLLSQEETLDLTWNRDYGNTEVLAYLMASVKPAHTIWQTRSYEAANMRFTVSAEGITLSRAQAGERERDVLPQGVPGWHGLQIFLDSPAQHSIGAQTKSLRQWKSYWRGVEESLFEMRSSVAKRVVKKVDPEVGTETFIRVLWKDEAHPNRFYCRIEDPVYEGEGWIDTYQKGGSMGMFHYAPGLDVDSFLLDGKPLLFRARVNSLGSPKEERRTYTFDCMSFIDDMLKEQAEYGEESDSTIFYRDEKNHVFCAVSQYGYGIFLPINADNAHYQVGDSVKVRLIDSTRANAMQGEIIGVAGKEVNVAEAATDVLRDYAEDDPYEETPEDLEEEAMAMSEDLFDTDYMRQIITIIDHKAVLETDNVRAYAFLAVAHILARMTGDQSVMDYLAQRLRLLCVLDEYGANGRVDDEELERLGSQNEDLADKYPLLRQRIDEMRIVNSLGMTERDGFLWEMHHRYDRDHMLSRLSRLMLSYNMAEGFGLQEHQQAIIAKIKTLLNVNVELPRIYSFGEENQLTEFKTSIVFPPGNSMREDLKQQTFNIMKVICGMVNAYGGTVYLGVNDTGTAKGLVEDLHCFEDSADKYDLYVRNSIRLALGDQVNASIVVEHPEAGKHYIYAIKVTPSKTPVPLRLDDNYYLREGTSTYPIDVETLTNIMAERNFATYHAEPKDMEQVEEPEAEPEVKQPEAPKAKETEEPHDEIATGTLRANVTQNWLDGYGVDTACYLRLQALGDWCVLDDIDWEDGMLTLAIHDEEADGYLVVVYDDGRVNKVPMSQITDKVRGKHYKMYAHKKPFFVCPARRDAALLMVYEDDKGKQYVRLDDLARMDDGKMLSAGNLLTDVEFVRVSRCEIVGKEYHEALRRMHNLKRNTLGQQAFTEYASKEMEALRGMGLDL